MDQEILVQESYYTENILIQITWVDWTWEYRPGIEIYHIKTTTTIEFISNGNDIVGEKEWTMVYLESGLSLPDPQVFSGKTTEQIKNKCQTYLLLQ